MAAYAKTIGSYLAPKLTNWAFGDRKDIEQRRIDGLTEIAAGVACVAYMFRDKIPEGLRVPMALVGVGAFSPAGNLAVGRVMMVTGVLNAFADREKGAVEIAKGLGLAVVGVAMQSKTVQNDYVVKGLQGIAKWLPPFDPAKPQTAK